MKMVRIWRRILGLASVVLVSLGTAGAEEARAGVDRRSAELWDKYIRNKPLMNILDNWELCRNMRLCKQAGKVDNRLAALATAVFDWHTRMAVCDFAYRERQFIAYAQNYKGTALTDEERKNVNALFAKAKALYGDRSKPIPYGTFYMSKALSLGLTVYGRDFLKTGKPSDAGGEDWIRRAVDKICRIHGWRAFVEDGKNIPFKKYKEVIDNNFPAIVLRDGYYKVVVGYLMTEKTNYLVVVDLAKIPLQITDEISSSAEKYYRSIPFEEPWRFTESRKPIEGKFVVDPILNPRMALPPGVVIEEFDINRYHAYFVYGWNKWDTKAIGPWEAEIKKVVKKKKKKKK